MKFLNELQSQLDEKDASSPPIHLWNPDLSGDIDIRIEANGDWFHEGVKIERQALVKMFSSILRRESDGEYYLLTPVEKWRIVVVDTALLAIDVHVLQEGQQEQQMIFTTNVQSQVLLSDDFPLSITFKEGSREPHPTILLPHHITAKLSRAVFYRLVDLAVEKEGMLSVVSNGTVFELGKIDD